MALTYEMGKIDGIREVVEWIENHRSFSTLISHMGKREWLEKKELLGLVTIVTCSACKGDGSTVDTAFNWAGRRRGCYECDGSGIVGKPN